MATMGNVLGPSEASIERIAVSAGLEVIDVRGTDRHADGDHALEVSGHGLFVDRVCRLGGPKPDEGSVRVSTLAEGRD